MTVTFEVDRSTLARRERALLRQLEAAYTPQLAHEVLIPLLTGTSPVSLRALDWMCTNFSKAHNVVCSAAVPGQTTNVHHAYRATLAFWKRKLFDPFRRRMRVTVHVDGVGHLTTLGQANFALFAYRTGTLAWVMRHIDEVEADMNSVSAKHKRSRREEAHRGQRHKRAELTRAAPASCMAYSSPTSIMVGAETRRGAPRTAPPGEPDGR